jgi:RNA polymerase sigma-70 factor (ECF subfamily)
LLLARNPAAARAPAPCAETDGALLSRVARGDGTAHRALFDRYRARVASFLQRRLCDRGLCEEVVSDVFFEVWRGAAAYRGESPVSAWIFGIARLKLLAALRFQARSRRAVLIPTADQVIGGAAADDTEHCFAARHELRRLLRALRALPKGQRDVVRLAFLGNHSYGEVAEALGISEGNVKTRINRARSRLRALMWGDA